MGTILTVAPVGRLFFWSFLVVVLGGSMGAKLVLGVGKGGGVEGGWVVDYGVDMTNK